MLVGRIPTTLPALRSSSTHAWFPLRKLASDEVLPVAVAVAAFWCLALASVTLARAADDIAAIWPANGVLAAALLLIPGRNARRVLVAGCWLGGVLGNLAGAHTLAVAIALACINVVEAGLVVRLIRAAGFLSRADLERTVPLTRFLLVCANVPVLAGAAAGLALHVLVGASFLRVATTWYVADALGFALALPTVLLLSDPRGWESITRRRPVEFGALFLLVVAVTTAVFWQTGMPLLFAMFPALILMTFRFGLVGAAAGLTAMAVVSVGFTLAEHGPTMLMHTGMTARIQYLQFFLAVYFVTVIPTASLISERARLQDRLRERELDLHEALGQSELALVARTGLLATLREDSRAPIQVMRVAAQRLRARGGVDVAELSALESIGTAIATLQTLLDDTRLAPIEREPAALALPVSLRGRFAAAA